jgi:hypothetical protein
MDLDSYMQFSAILFWSLQDAYQRLSRFRAIDDGSASRKVKESLKMGSLRKVIARRRVADDHPEADKRRPERPSGNDNRSDYSAFGLIRTSQLLSDADEILRPFRETVPVPGVFKVQVDRC